MIPKFTIRHWRGAVIVIAIGTALLAALMYLDPATLDRAAGKAAQQRELSP